MTSPTPQSPHTPETEQGQTFQQAYNWRLFEEKFTSGYCFVGGQCAFTAPIKVSLDSGRNELQYNSKDGIEIPGLQGAMLTIISYGECDLMGVYFEVQGQTTQGKPVKFKIGLGPYDDVHFISTDSVDYHAVSIDSEPLPAVSSVEITDPKSLPSLSASLPPYSAAVNERDRASNELERQRMRSEGGLEGMKETGPALPGKTREEDNPQRHSAENLEAAVKQWGYYGRFSNVINAALQGECVPNLQLSFARLEQLLEVAKRNSVPNIAPYARLVDQIRSAVETHFSDLTYIAGGYVYLPSASEENGAESLDRRF